MAEIYRDEGRYADAEPLIKQALAIWQKASMSEHPSAASSLEIYADLLRKTNRAAEAAEIEARAKAIRARHSP